MPLFFLGEQIAMTYRRYIVYGLGIIAIGVSVGLLFLWAKQCYSPSDVWEAIGRDNISAVKKFVENDAELLKKYNSYGETLLFLAAKKDNEEEELVRLFLEKGADVDQGTLHRENQPLMMAAISGHSRIVDMLIEAGADVNKPNKDGLTALHCAVSWERIEISEKLLMAGAEVDRPLPMQLLGLTLVHMASGKGLTGLAEQIIAKGGLVNAQCRKGRTPLHLAAIAGYTETVRFLLKSGANPEIRDKANKMALDLAKENQQGETVEVIQQYLGKLRNSESQKLGDR